MWVVVLRTWGPSHATSGCVGRVPESEYDRSKPNDQIEVQFGANGPMSEIKKKHLIPLAAIVKRVEDLQGCRYDRYERD